MAGAEKPGEREGTREAAEGKITQLIPSQGGPGWALIMNVMVALQEVVTLRRGVGGGAGEKA